MNVLWVGMILVGVVYGAFSGTLGEMTTGMLDSSREAIMLGITMLGAIGFWMGIMEIAVRAGVIEKLSKVLNPMITWLYPGIPTGHKAKEYISTNMIANFLGLGWAATPAGLEAMKELRNLKREEDDRASDEMCTLLVINISSLQLIPINIIAYRSQYGSEDPSGILGAAIIATALSTVVGIAFCKFMTRYKVVNVLRKE